MWAPSAIPFWMPPKNPWESRNSTAISVCRPGHNQVEIIFFSMPTPASTAR